MRNQMSYKFKSLLAALAVMTAAAGCVTETPSPELLPQVAALSNSELRVGETLYLVADGVLSPQEGDVLLEFEGIYVWEDEDGNEVVEDVPSFTIRPVYDGRFPEGGTVGDTSIGPEQAVLRWNRFGPWGVPFGGNGKHAGTFKGTVAPINVPHTGATVEGRKKDIAIDIQPSILINVLEPVLGADDNNDIRTPGCDAPALRVFGGMPYVLEVEAMGIKPEYWIYDIADINGSRDFITITHPADGAVDRVGDPAWHSDEILVFNKLAADVDHDIAAIRVTAVDADNNTVSTALPVPVVRPVQFSYNGNRELAEYYEPVPVYGPVVAGINTTLTYAESQSESRQHAVSVGFSQSFTQSQSASEMQNWNEGYAVNTSASTTEAMGISTSESRDSSESYGTSYSSSESTSVGMASTNGTDWGWSTSQGTSQEEYESQLESLYGSVSGEVSAETNGGVSIPGVANVGGKVGTSVGTSTEQGQQNTTGQRVGASQSTGSSMGESESATESFGSVTTDGESQTVTGSYGVSSQSAINTGRSETTATSESVTYDLGGGSSITEGYSQGSSEDWSETWVSTTDFTQSFAINQQIPNGRCGVVYRQTVRYVRTAQIYQHDLCGVRTLMSELNFNEWSWSPNIAQGDDCEESLPESTLPKAECFFACE